MFSTLLLWSIPGILYGQPKIYKPLVPRGPNFSSINTPSYALSKFLVPLLFCLTKNKFFLIYSSDLPQELSSVADVHKLTLASFDVKNLFANSRLISL